jgi:hypothetical protein
MLIKELAQQKGISLEDAYRLARDTTKYKLESKLDEVPYVKKMWRYHVEEIK